MSTETPTDIESRVVWISQNPSAEEYLGAYPYVPATFLYHLCLRLMLRLAIKDRDEAVQLFTQELNKAVERIKSHGTSPKSRT